MLAFAVRVENTSVFEALHAVDITVHLKDDTLNGGMTIINFRRYV